MALYRYQATDAAGKHHQGSLEADQERDARARLRAQGLWVLELAAVRAAPGRGLKLDGARQAFLVSQWASLLASGLTVEQSLDTLIGQCEDQGEEQLLSSVRAAVRGGESLARALEHHPRAFDASFCALVAAGESAGKLPQLLERMAAHLEARRALRQKIGLALLYPMIVALVAMGVVIALLTFVVPQVVEVFLASRQVLPLPTRALLAVSAFFRDYGLWLLALLLPGAGFGAWQLRRPLARERLHPGLMRLPLLGRLLRQSDAGRIAAVLGVLTEAGVPLLSALDIAARSARLAPLRHALGRGARAVREGLPLSRALGAEPVFPPILARMAAVGESSGRLGAMLSQAGRQLDNETAYRSAWLAGVLEPLTILAMGALVLAIVLAVLLPIIEMNPLLK